MSVELLFAILILSPLVGSLINGCRRGKVTPRLSGTIATLAVLISFAAAVGLVFALAEMPENAKVLTMHAFDWIFVGNLRIPASFIVDPVSAIMIMIITGVGTLIHVFSIGYMSHDDGVTKYFCYLNLFLFNMLLLVLGDSLPVLFVGWEGVGLCSYLLIGYWFSDEQKATAGMKAFVTNRIGDAAFLIGMFILFTTYGTLNFSELNAIVPHSPELLWSGPITLATLFLFVGATGKSAQIPLYVWLPDAMAGPTPVSALIHAATMVTAGVYMIIRMHPVFLMAPNTLSVIAIIGAATALFAATIGTTQFDIKKILAYSTVSQLGYMFLACGVGAFGAALFHLMTHAFFKALMFLGSGSVIHGMHEEQDIRKMGGLKKYLPWTHLTFLIGWLAILGIPPFAGFFSKDEILASAFGSAYGGIGLYVVGVIAAGFTSFYMTRLMALTFWGKSRVSHAVHPHESPWIMLFPLVALAIFSLVGGWVGIPDVLRHTFEMEGSSLWVNWLHPAFHAVPKIELDHETEWLLMAISLSVVVLSAVFSLFVYLKNQKMADGFEAKFPKFYGAISHKYYVDEFYQMAVLKPLVRFSELLWFYFDVGIVDRATVLISNWMKSSGQFVRGLQNGNMQRYAMYISLGVSIALLVILMR